MMVLVAMSAGPMGGFAFALCVWWPLGPTVRLSWLGRDPVSK